MLAHDLDVRFISRMDEIDGSFMLKVKAMAIEGGRGSIVEDRLVGKRDIEHRPEHKGGLPRAQGEGDVKGEDQAKDVGALVDGPQIDGWLLGFGKGKFVGLVMVLPVLVTQFKLRAPFLEERLFPLVQLSHLLYAVGTGIVTAFVDGHLFPLFPGKEGMLAVGTIIGGLSALAEPLFQLEELPADLAQELGSLLPVIVVQVVMGSIAAETPDTLRHPNGTRPVLYWS
jgi:hypothetical protein